MYQALYRHQAQRWLYWSMILVVITFSACGYYAYYLVQQVKTLSLLQSQYQKREYSLQNNITMTNMNRKSPAYINSVIGIIINIGFTI